MKKVVTVIFFFTQLAFAQPQIGWQKTIGGSGGDYLYAIETTADGGYLLGGASASNISGEKSENSKGNSDYWIVKTDESGNIQWQKTIGGAGNDFLGDLALTSDGGYILAGRSDSGNTGDKTETNRGSTDYWIVKVDGSGQIVWDKTVGGNWPEQVYDVLQTPDGGYLINGISNSGVSGDKTVPTKGSHDLWLVKLSASGQIESQIDYGGDETEQFSSIVPTADGGYILACQSFSGVNGDRTVASTTVFDAWLLKLDASLQIEWQKAYPMDDVRKVIQLADGNYILGGSSWTHYLRSASYQICSLVLKIDADGDEMWHYRIQPTYGDCVLSDIIESDAHDLYFTTHSQSTGISASVAKLTPAGNLAWVKPIYAASGADNLANTLRETDDHGIIVGLASDGNTGGMKTEDSRGDSDFWAVKFEPEVLGTGNHAEIAFAVASNPVGEYLSIISGRMSNFNIEIYNDAGQLVVTKAVSAIETQIAFPYASGIYFAKFTDAMGRSQTIKIIKQ
jgi:hypothetical protein